MKLSYPGLLRKARERAGLSTRQLQADLEAKGVRASVTFVNQIENAKTKPPFDFVYSAAELTGLQVEEALRAAFVFRVQWCVDRERETLRSLAKDKGLSEEVVEKITSLRSLK
jgi:transcriptional regulator with XRE-family HTH domain